MNALQVFPNLIGVVGLSGVVAGLARDRRRVRSHERDATRVGDA
jgi:hypothetical protein